MNDSQARKEMDDVAALAESIQPKGNTLLTTSVSFNNKKSPMNLLSKVICDLAYLYFTRRNNKVIGFVEFIRTIIIRIKTIDNNIKN